MSDNPGQTSSSSSDNKPTVGGWFTPSQQGSWRMPEKKGDAAVSRMAALPENLEQEPAETGSWHLPDPKDTKFEPGQEIDVRSPEDMLAEAEAAPTPKSEPKAAEPAQTTLTPEDELLQLVKSMVGEQELVAEKPQSPEDMVALLEQIADEEELPHTQTGALMSLAMVEEAKPAPAAAPVEESETLEVTQPPTSGQSGDYVKQMLQELEAEEGGDTSIAADTSALDPRTQELARRFAETEEEVRTLRTMLQQGSITPDEFQAQLRNLMIMDDDQVWWVMGQEADQWFKHLNGEWVAATPPRLPTPASPTLRFTTDQILAEDAAPAQQPTFAQQPSGIALDENNMPLPRQVDIHDQNMTVVGPSYLADVRPSDAYTVAGVTYPSPAAQPTVPMQPVDVAQPVNYGAGYEVPAPATMEPARPSLREEQQRSNVTRVLIIAALGIGLLIALVAGFVVVASNAFYNNTITNYQAQIAALANYQPEFQTVTIQDYDGRTIATLSQGGNERVTVSLEDISPFAIHAALSMADPQFYEEPEWGFGETLNAFFVSLSGGTVSNPEPTITQQIARRFVLGNTNTTQATSSIEELVIAGELAKRYSRNQLLELYLNEIFFGNQSYGIEAASRFYYDRSADELNLPQAALIAGLIEDPVTYDPVTNREIAFVRMETVLDNMVAVGCLNMQHGSVGRFCVTTEDRQTPRTVLDNALVRTADYFPRRASGRYAHFVQLVRQQLEAAFPNLYTTGFVVRTTLVPELQDRVEASLRRALETNLAGTGITTGAIVATDPRSGAVRVYVGSHNYQDQENQGENDYARLYHAPGQSISPILYAAALDGADRNGNGVVDTNEYLTLANVTWDVPGQYAMPDGTGFNVASKYSGVFYGPVPLRAAVANGYSGSAADVYQIVGDAKLNDMANRMGHLFTRTNPQISWLTAIGETPVRLIDMVSAYGTISNGGTRYTPYIIEAITDANGNVVEVPEILRPAAERALSPQINYLVQNALSDATARNTQVFPQNNPLTLANLPRQNFVGAMVGTSEGARDLWTMGFTSNAVVGVWLGRPDGNGIPNQTGLSAAAPIWNEVMSLISRSQPSNPPREFANPGSVGPQTICPETGSATGQCPSPLRAELFAAARPPQDNALTASIMVNSWTRQRINSFCPDTQDGVTLTVANIQNQNVINYLRSPQGRAYAQRIGLGDNFSTLPIAECDQNSVIPQANITSPAQGQEIIGAINVLGQVNAPASFNRYQLEIAPAGQNQFRPLPGFPQTIQQPAPNSTLGTWDTTGLTNGQYQLRLSVIASDGGYINRTVIVAVNNPPPTPTPTPTPTVTPQVLPPIGEATQPGFFTTPLPFDTPAFQVPSPTFTPDIF